MKPFFEGLLYTSRSECWRPRLHAAATRAYLSLNIFQERYNCGLGWIVQVRHDAVVGVGFDYAFELGSLRRQDEKSW